MTTKGLIQEAFLKPLAKMPRNKITGIVIVAERKISRNTFYEDCDDIDAFLEEVFQESLSEIIEEYDANRSREDSFHLAIRFVVENPKATCHIYYSVRRVRLEHYLLSASEKVPYGFVRNVLPEKKASESDRKLLAHFYSCAMAAMVLTWIADGMKEDPDELIDRIGFLMDGSIEEAIARSEEENRKKKG